jgi:hypothetical protein
VVGTNGVKSGVASGAAVAAAAGLAAAVLVVAAPSFVGARWSSRPVAMLPMERWRLSTRAGAQEPGSVSVSNAPVAEVASAGEAAAGSVAVSS